MWPQVIATIVSFLALEGLFFVSVQTSGADLGRFGSLHRALWVLVRAFGAGVVKVAEGMKAGFEAGVVVLGGVSAAVAACQAEESLDAVEHGATCQAEESLEADEPAAEAEESLGTQELGKEDLEANPPPPYYVSVLLSISFTAYQDPIMQYTLAPENVVLRDTEEDIRTS